MTNDISFTFMPRDSTELEKMSLAELIIHLAMKGYKINFRKTGWVFSLPNYSPNDKDDCRALVIELQKEFLGKCYSKKTIIDREIFDSTILSCEHILKSNILRAVSEFDKYDENKKKVTT